MKSERLHIGWVFWRTQRKWRIHWAFDVFYWLNKICSDFDTYLSKNSWSWKLKETLRDRIITLVFAISHSTTSSPTRLGDFVLRRLRIYWHDIEAKITEPHIFVISVLIANSALFYLRVLDLRVLKHPILKVVIAFRDIYKTLSLVSECLSLNFLVILKFSWLKVFAVLVTRLFFKYLNPAFLPSLLLNKFTALVG